jgi:dihydroorotase
MNAQVLRRALSYGRMFDALIVQHCEDPDLVGEGVMNEGEFAARLGLHGVPPLAETVVLERDLRILAATGGRYHAALLSSAESLPILRAAKARGVAVTAGVSINHLSFNENDVGAYRTFFKLAPPLRSEDDRQALIEALADGLIDVIVSDHNPQDVETKRLTFAEAAHGAAGLETMLSAGLRLVQEGQVTLPRLIHAMATAPSDILRLPTGRLTPGGGCHRLRCRGALGLRSGRIEGPIEEHTLRRREDGRPGQADGRRRQCGVRGVGNHFAFAAGRVITVP